MHPSSMLLLCGSLAFLACIYVDEDPPPKHSSTTASSGAGGGSDGKYHPPKNSVQISELAACEAIAKVIENTHNAQQCGPLTSHNCPLLLRSIYQTACMKYDEGTVKGCVDYFSKMKDCKQLDPELCVLVGYPETAPSGCP